MTATETDLRARIEYLIHVGLVEIRCIAEERGAHAQIAHLADVLEFLPGYIRRKAEPDFALVREQFEKYAQRFPDSFGQRFLDILDGKQPVPDHY